MRFVLLKMVPIYFVIDICCSFKFNPSLDYNINWAEVLSCMLFSFREWYFCFAGQRLGTNVFTLHNEEDFCVFTCTCVNGRVIVRKVEWFWSKWIVTRVAKAKGYVNVTVRWGMRGACKVNCIWWCYIRSWFVYGWFCCVVFYLG